MSAAPRPDRWLAGAMGHAVYTVAPGMDGAWAAAGHRPEGGRAMYQASLPADAVAEARLLCDAGFYPVDTAITLRHRVPPADVAGPPVVDASPAHHAAVLEIAGAVFRSRFHLDPLVPDAVAHRIKREWAANCLAGARGIGVRVALVDGAVAGFLAALETGRGDERLRVIDLVAVGPAHQGRGVGRALVADFLGTHAGRADGLTVGTQAGNVASLALYERMGFRLAEARLALHRHVGIAA